MRVRTSCLFLFAICGGMCVPQCAEAQQKKTNPQVNFVHPGGAKAVADINELFSLLNPAEQKQKANLLDFVETFMIGVDRRKQIQVNLLFGGGTRYLVNIPVSDIEGFRENIEGLGVYSKPKGKLFQLSGEFKGWMAYRSGYVTISENAADVQAGIAVNAKVKAGDSLTFQLVNQTTDAASQAARKTDFENTRRELLSVYKIATTESQAAFASRKQAYVNQLDELERFFVQSGQYISGWKYDKANKTGNLYFELTAIPGTELDKTIAQFSQESGYFDNLPKASNSILSGRFNHPVDARRKQAIQAFLSKSITSLSERIEKSVKITAGEKPSAKKLAELGMQLLAGGAKGGSFQGFIDVVPANGNGHHVIGGVKTPIDQSQMATEAIKAWVTAREGQQLKPNVDKVGNVAIHALRLKLRNPEVAKFFGPDPTVYLGVGPETLWYSIGPDGLNRLKTTISTVAASQNNATAKTKTVKDTRAVAINGDTKLEVTQVKQTVDGKYAIDMQVRLLPWMQLLDKLRAKQPVPADRQGKTKRKEQDERRARILSALKGGDDKMAFRMHRDGKTIKGSLQVVAGLIRFVGKEVAVFTKDNLSVD